MQAGPSSHAVKTLYALSGGLCAFPGCSSHLVDRHTRALLGQVCHIRAKAPTGPRFDPRQSENERNQIDNLIILCATHHRLVDNDPVTYSADALVRLKQQHEEQMANLLDQATTGLTDRQAKDLSRQIEEQTIDFAIVVSLQAEFDAIIHYFPEFSRGQSDDIAPRSYCAANIPTKNGNSYRVLVTLLGALGNSHSAHVTSELIRKWNPRYILIAGIASGISKGPQDYGDIVVSSSVVYYEHRAGNPHRIFHADPTLLSSMRNMPLPVWEGLASMPAAANRTAGNPRVHIGPIASGSPALSTASERQELLSMHRGFVALEMESAGVASAAFSAVKRVGFLTIRSICDFPDDRKSDCWHEYATHSVACYLRQFIEAQPVPLSEGSWPDQTESLASHAYRAPTVRRGKLFEQICKSFDMEDFKNLCFLLGVDIDELAGERKSSRARELISRFERDGNLEVLEEAVFTNASPGASRPSIAPRDNVAAPRSMRRMSIEQAGAIAGVVGTVFTIAWGVWTYAYPPDSGPAASPPKAAPSAGQPPEPRPSHNRPGKADQSAPSKSAATLEKTVDPADRATGTRPVGG